MKLIIAGGRDIEDVSPEEISVTCEVLGIGNIEEVVSGGCSGIDLTGEMFALAKDIKTKIFNADWDKYGKAAGPIRNKEMAEYADALLLIWDGKSKGSANMLKIMKKLGKPVYQRIIGE